jgi:hypothetical protein
MGMIRGAALSPEMSKAAPAKIISTYLPSFPLNLKSEIFSERSGIRLTIRRESASVKITNPAGESVNDVRKPGSE